jgi:NADPH:quinone reductase-like Zn-dependent oxidoreductase
VLELTGGAGVERVVEVDFGANQATDIAVLKRNGTIASYSSSTAPEAGLPYYDFAFKGATLRFVQGFAMPEAARDLGQRAIADLAAEGRLTAAVALRLPLERIADAHAAVERGGLMGNVVVEID